ncbi:MAG: zinc ribbon domain-containing protein [Firmicutes bacterium]|nr:zinc ribbon domain-containing protein [Bacillota bacterium]
MMFCRRCGAEIPVDSVYCPSCGSKLVASRSSVEEDVITPPQPAREAVPMGGRLRQRYQTGIQGVTQVKVYVQQQFKHVAAQHILVGMGCLFGVVGFLWGLLGHQRALDWLLFGLLLVLVGIYFKPPLPPENKSHQKEMTD